MFIRSSVHERLDCFHLLAAVNHAAVHMGARISGAAFLSQVVEGSGADQEARRLGPQTSHCLAVSLWAHHFVHLTLPFRPLTADLTVAERPKETAESGCSRQRKAERLLLLLLSGPRAMISQRHESLMVEFQASGEAVLGSRDQIPHRAVTLTLNPSGSQASLLGHRLLQGRSQ